MEKLTPREYGIFSFVCQYVQDYQQSPTRKEIGRAFKMTAQGADYHIKKLVQKGFLDLSDHKKRNIQLVKKHYRKQISLFD